MKRENKTTLNDFLYSDFYTKYLLELDKKLTTKIDFKSKISDVIIELEIEWLEKASISLDNLKYLIVNHKEKTVFYIVKKMSLYLESNGGKDAIINYPPQINVSIGHLIEYFLILNRQEYLLDFMKFVGMPGAKKYVKEIKNIFLEIQEKIE